MEPVPLSILLVEDNPADARLIELLFTSRPHEPVEILRAGTLAQAQQLLAVASMQGRMPDIILLDTGLPDVEPRETVLAVAAMAPKTPIVVLSGQADESVAVQAVRDGAQDYLVKGRIDAELLARSIRYAVERKKSAEALRESEDRFQSFMNNSPAVAYMKDEHGRYAWANLLFERVFGKSADSWAGKTDFDLWPHDVAAKLRENDSTALAAERPIEVQETIPGADGLREWLTLKFPFESAAGRRFLAGMSVDITQRVRAEEALREAEAARMHAVHLQSETLNALPAQVALIDSDGTILVVNESWQRQGVAGSAKDPGFGVGSNYVRIAEQADGPCPDGPVSARGIKAVLAGQMPYFAHEYASDLGERPRWFRMLVSPILGREHRGAVVMHLDVTDRKAAEESLRRSEERYRLIVETAQEGIWLVDNHWQTTLVNGRLCEMLGYEASEMIGRHLLDFVDESVRSEALALMRRREQGTNEYLDFRFLRKGGGELWATVSTSTIHDAGSGFSGALAMLTDATERRRAERALRDADEQLRQAQKMEAVGMLASGVAHDFNNLLTAIRGYASLARSSLYEDHPALESLDQVEEASRQASGVAGALLTFARKTRSEKLPVRLANVVESAARLFRRTLPAGVKFTVEVVAGGDLWVSGDETQLHQVVMNLALNARDAIDRAGEISLRLQAGPPSSSGQPVVEMVVVDNGCGMAPEVQNRIFEPFFTTKPRGRGTGLGLSVIHGIVAEHGGSISVVTAPNRGSEFTVTLPAIDPPAKAQAAPLIRAGAPQSAGVAVIAQNSALVRGVVASMLTTLGYECLHSGSAAEARNHASVSSRPIALLVADAQLADSTGLELLASLRRANPGVKGILVTDTLPAEDNATELGAVWLRKPFRVNDLQQSLARLSAMGAEANGSSEAGI